MKNKLMMLLLLVVSYGFSQSVNDYKAVIIPIKYDFLKTENQYRLQTITKMNLQKAGFQAFYITETIPVEITDRCSLLYVDVKKENGFLITKLLVIFRDCYGNEIYKSEIGKSREKEFEAAYTEALNNAFNNINRLKYAYNGNANFGPKAGGTAQTLSVFTTPTVDTKTPETTSRVVIPQSPAEIVPIKTASTPNNEAQISQKNSTSLLYAQPTSYGYQLIDSEPKVVIKVYKISNPTSYIATKRTIQGVLVSKENQWFFEYYQNDKLISEKVEVKFQ